MSAERRIEVGVLGGTGMVGQQFVAQLVGHPWFKLAWVGASERSSGRKYKEAASWKLATPMSDDVADLTVDVASPGGAPRLVFSALDASVAGEIEQAFAAAGHLVVSNARNHRMVPNVPLLIPEVNADHLALLQNQAEGRDGRGAIVTNPNCSTIVLALALAPLRSFSLKTAIVTTLQAVSGAGYPGTPSMDILGNVIPFIGGEEEKMESETQKILGSIRSDHVEPHSVAISAHTTRVPVVDGHTEMISVGFERPPAAGEILEAFRTFSGKPQELRLPTAPSHPLLYLEEANRPQPRLDAERGRGMTVTLGRLRPCHVLDYKFVALGHNTIRGAAGAAVLNAELLSAEGLLD